MNVKDLNVGKLDFREWSDRERHLGSVVVIITVAVVLAVGILLQFAAPDVADVALWGLLGVVVLALAYQGGAVYAGLTAGAADGDGEADGDVAADADAAWAPPADAPEPDAAPPGSITLRCGECRTEFEVADDGSRPLYHTCPGCNAEGVLEGDDAPAPQSGEADAAPAEADAATGPPATESGEDAHAPPEPGEEPFPDEAPAAPPAEAEAEAPPVKHLKLRCGGCKHVFRLEDPGTRPLRSQCPSCGRLGEIK